MNSLPLDASPNQRTMALHLSGGRGGVPYRWELPVSGTFYEFFAGGGMARAGLGTGWECLFANDIDPHKAESYRQNWGAEDLHLGDVGLISTDQVPGKADLAWASFPCQDLSLAGAYRGLEGARSGTFWAFWRLMNSLSAEGRGPKLIVLENVFGALTSHGGADFAMIAEALTDGGYEFGAMIIDARLFLPQSRPRLFIVAASQSAGLGPGARSIHPVLPWHTTAVRAAYNRLPPRAKENWVWWAPPVPRARVDELNDVLEDEPKGVPWHAQAETDYLLSLMNPLHRAKVEEARRASKAQGTRIVGGIYRRTREGQQRAEVRFDGVAGCLRTPSGGSSRQSLIIIESGRVRTRLLSPREAARLMGLPERYRLPVKYNRAYQLAGDGVVVPAVRHLAKTLLEPMVLASHEELELAVAAQ